MMCDCSRHIAAERAKIERKAENELFLGEKRDIIYNLSKFIVNLRDDVFYRHKYRIDCRTTLNLVAFFLQFYLLMCVTI